MNTTEQVPIASGITSSVPPQKPHRRFSGRGISPAVHHTSSIFGGSCKDRMAYRVSMLVILPN